MKFVSLMMVVTLMFSGCDFGSITNALKPDTVSSFNKEAMFNSIKHISKTLPIEKRKQYNQAVAAIIMYNLEVLAKDQDRLMYMTQEEIDQTLIDLLGGKNVDEVIEFAQEVAK